jgi:hypothetical protein
MQADLISALSTATEHKAIEACGINRQLVPGIRMKGEQLDADFGKHFGEQTRLVHIPMLDEENFFHVRNLNMPIYALK